MIRIILSLLTSLLISISSGCGGTVPGKGVPIRVGSQESSKVYELPLERYLIGVLEKEVAGTWPMEALKAQAVASRTYALYRKANPRHERFDLTADTSDQVFQQKRRHSDAVVQAVQETEGETLDFDGEIFQAFFHSCCGGMSERADQVWAGIKTPSLLTTHGDPYCNACPRNHWEYQMPREELTDLLRENGYPLREDWKIEIAKRDESGRVSEIRFGEDSDLPLSGTKLREIVGYTKLPSTLFEIKDSENDRIVFSGKGSGHGVGLCQWGAKGMAEEGKNYREILEFYYPGATVHPSSLIPQPSTVDPD
jgi:stage II sporulation protein D